MIYHMCRADEWAAAIKTGTYRGSSQDLADIVGYLQTLKEARKQ